MFPAESRILVVDDMVMMRTLLKGQLRQLGYTAISDAEDGQKAFDLLMKQHEARMPFDLIFSDWNMPNLTGIELLRRIRGAPQLKDLPFILVTAEGEPNQVKEAIELGVSNFIRKPFAPSVLKEKIEAVYKKFGKAA